MGWLLRLRIHVAAWLHRCATRLEPDVDAWARLFPSYVLVDVREQVTIAVQLQGVDDQYRVRRVLKQIKRRYPSVPDGDVIVVATSLLDAAPRPTQPLAEDKHYIPSGLRRRPRTS